MQYWLYYIIFLLGIEEFDREAEKRYTSIRKEMQGLLNEANLTVLKLCAISQEVKEFITNNLLIQTLRKLIDICYYITHLITM